MVDSLLGKFSRSERRLLIGRDHRDTVLSLDDIVVLLRQLSYAIKTQLKAPNPISYLSLVIYGIRIGGFHAGKGSIIVAGVSNIMISSLIDSFCACPPITVSLWHFRTSVVLPLLQVRSGRGSAVELGHNVRLPALGHGESRG